jgi:hypothetical protein
LNLHLISREVDLTESTESVLAAMKRMQDTHGLDGLLCCARLPLPVNSRLLRVWNYAAEEAAADGSSSSSGGTQLANSSGGQRQVEGNNVQSALESVPERAISSANSNSCSSGGTSHAACTSLAPSQPTSTFDLSGFVFSTPRVLSNIQVAMRDLPTGVPISLDGTYKLVNNGWTLLVVGTHTVGRPAIGSTPTSGTYAHSFLPFVMALSKSESEQAYRSLLGVMREVAYKLYNSIIIVRSACTNGHIRRHQERLHERV